MLIDYQYFNYTNTLKLSIINEKGNLEMKSYIWEQPFKYETCNHDDPNVVPNIKSWDKKHVRKVSTTMPDRYSVYEFIDSMEESERKLIYGYAIPNIYFIDIETAKDENGYSTSDEARCEIQTISIVYDNKVIVLGTREMSEKAIKKIIDDSNEYVKAFNVKYQFKYIRCADEYAMLKHLFENMLLTMPCITGWNFLDYDWKYLVNRAKRIQKVNADGTISQIRMSESSPTKKFEPVYRTSYEMPKHKLIYDYMTIYKKLDTSIKIKESASLDFVAENILGIKKIKVVDKNDKAIDLTVLHDTDYEKFIYYNIIDSVLVQLIHKKMRYIEIIFSISAVAKITAMDTFSVGGDGVGSLAITEGVLRDRFRNMHDVVFFRDNKKAPVINATRIEGGFVGEPVRGMNRWVAVYDFSSMYPTGQMQFFISPENYLGQVDSFNTDYYIDCNTYEKKLIIYDEMTTLGNGAVFLKRISATIDMLQTVFKQRRADKKISLFQKDTFEQKVKMLAALKAEI